MILGWFGVSGTPLVAKQLPYLVSGGLGGLALVFLGGLALGAADIRRAAARLDRLERQVGDLHRLLLVETGTPDAGVAVVGVNGRVAVLPGGQSYHRPACAVVVGKDAESVTVAAAAGGGLRACKLCEPPPPAGDAVAGDPTGR